MNKRRKIEENYWISFSDIMTGLMIIFMFIAIAYIVKVQEQQVKLMNAIEVTEENQRVIEEIVKNYDDTKFSLYKELDSLIKNSFQGEYIEVSNDLSVKFSNPSVIFSLGSSEITSAFKKTLDNFIPKYLEIINKKKYQDKILEIRIEGHTDTVRFANAYDNENNYILSIELSQERAKNVLAHVRKINFYQNLKYQDKRRLDFLLTCNGMAYGRTLDINKKLTYSTNKPVNNDNSRRVEFRIITTSEKVIEDIMEKFKK
ncbi:MAG: OmpA family protein [Bernardetiaceae bacterium]|nr:OmpA family protein [Bernardetiaceae bacterium]